MSKRKSVLAMASTLIWSVAGWSADSGALGLFRIDPTKPGVALFDLPLQVVPPSVANAPYSADEVLEVDRKLPNGERTIASRFRSGYTGTRWGALGSNAPCHGRKGPRRRRWSGWW